MIESLFPSGVHAASGPFDPDAILHPDEKTLAAAMSRARRVEFSSGRACARRAMRALGCEASAVLRGERRVPLWPEGVVGSITHTDDWCAAAVGRSSAWRGIGLDAEGWEPLSSGAFERICSPAEQEGLGALPDHTPQQWATALFSAKESLYKALFPITCRFLGFRDAVIELAPDSPSTGRFVAKLLQADSVQHLGAERFEGRYTIDLPENRVVTALALPAVKQPDHDRSTPEAST